MSSSIYKTELGDIWSKVPHTTNKPPKTHFAMQTNADGDIITLCKMRTHRFSYSVEKITCGNCKVRLKNMERKTK